MAAQADFNIVSSSSNLVDLNNNFEIKVIDTKKVREFYYCYKLDLDLQI